MTISCPHCETVPAADALWSCSCQHHWNIFETEGRCPNCEQRLEENQCPYCTRWSLHADWYPQRPPAPFLPGGGSRIGRMEFAQPSNPMARVFRYLTLQKYVSLLRDRSLYLARLDLFDDKLEGSLTKRCLAEVEAGTREIPEYLVEAADRKLWSRQFYASCWHMRDHETEGMWRLYGESEGAVCIVSKYARLARIQSEDTALGVVSYVDYSSDDFHYWNQSAPFMHKRVQYADEREVRILLANVCPYFFLTREEVQERLENTQARGYRLRCSPEFLVEQVRVAPFANDSFYAKVTALTERLCPELLPRVRWSEMKAEGSF